AKTISQDRSSANKGGYVGFIGINLYEPSFEDAVFALQKDGDYSAPVESSVGWHIIKRLGKRGTESFEKAKPRLKTKITQDSRFEQARNAMVARIKKDANYSDSAKGYEQFVNSTDSTFLTYKWQTPTSELPDATELFRFGKNNIYSINDFYEFLKKNSRKRINYGATNTNRNDAIKSLFNDFVAESALKNEEKNLDAKYPEFKSLLREYEEGILLFEVTKNNVWDKASQDSVGLAAFYPTVADKYKWDERVVTSYYTVQNAQDTVTLEKIRKYAIKKTPEKVLKKFNKKGVNVVSVQDKTFEKGKNEALNKMKWEVGTLSYNEKNMQANTTSFLKIEKLLPITNKTLAEARGYVVADYQDYLEKEWVKSLQNAYKVNVNQKVFDSLVK
ncbi:MAG: peptidylprolyl isomerase, partial [Saprospiraceae bacterium]|nr:peptidylprolyl isomerase [Saprospiraceae bacterium]